MYGYVLQDWITIRSTNISDIIQGESDWMAFSSFQDIVFWADIRELTLPTGGTPGVTMKFETSPTKDEVLFQTMASTPVSVATPITPLPKVILAAAPSVPLATWVRWRLTPAGGAGPWDVTFRILVAANRVARGAA